ncbi:hypothetical protein IMCC20628_00461 [Hoeflea sp. IMCC20628]|uniref:hypothetical protein n=1 Tax=Hoeflea sp. IMCC20628 TaxID=1620421 RepID=UPI00063A8886|nr:hypothetical protein [Hoeflea sp. IMCC20628]AKH99186.1 hypothetical protein IMCC20628_00461 [Hoeflea sp. IMCC20628]
MADFVAVIRKAVDNLPDNTPENRIKVYDKARAAIRRQLEAMNPQPSDEVIARQLDKLNLAVDEVEIEHAEALPAEDDEADALMAELESMVEKSPVIAEPVAPPPSPAKAPAPVAAPTPPAPVAPVAAQMAPSEPDELGEPDEPVVAQPKATSRPSDLVGSAHDEAFGLDSAPHRQNKTSPKRGSSGGKGRLVALALVLVLGAAAYAGWSYKDEITAMLWSSTIDQPVVTEEVQPAEDAAAVTPEPAPAEPVTPAEPAAGDTDGVASKFTQRLGADGTETDAGPAPGPDVDDTSEGRSVAELTDAGPVDETVAEANTAETPTDPADATAPNAQPLGVAQKMILYEERLGQQSLEVKNGTVVWTLVSEASGDGPDEQVIRGEINNPDTGLSALITFKRNTDPSLPASHIVEIVFAVPTDFAGGSIDQLQRIALKQTEADQGSPLIAVPAKITQDFYMVALNDLDEARKTNTELLRQRNWIDIPVVYANGRQALITLEKGASGTEVFNQALDAWAKAAPQN